VIRQVRLSAGLAVVYVLTLVSTDGVDLATGAVIGLVLTTAIGDRLRLGPGGALPGFLQRVVWAPVFAGAVAVDVVAGTWDVALRVLHLRPFDRAGIVRVPVGDRSDRGVAVSALVTTLSPGTVLVDVDWDRREMLMHLVDASDEAAARARLQRMYDRYQRRVLP
jgi:multicomponent K+:H+ antiporter subunit E/multicomponent Na+:H+ antiporter subunit E